MADGKMTQADMIKKIAEGTGIAPKYVKEVVEATVDLVRAELLAGREVKVTNLGTFRTHTRAARTYNAPLTDKPVKKPGDHHRQVQGNGRSQEGLYLIIFNIFANVFLMV